MGTRTRRALWILAGGVAAPFVARLIFAVRRGPFLHEIERWIDHWSRWPLRDAAVGWLWFLLPFWVLALLAAFFPARPARWAIFLSSWAAFLGGIYCSMPEPGHGYRFYLGEAVFPIVCAMFVGIPMVVGFLAGWYADRAERV